MSTKWLASLYDLWQLPKTTTYLSLLILAVSVCHNWLFQCFHFLQLTYSASCSLSHSSALAISRVSYSCQCRARSVSHQCCLCMRPQYLHLVWSVWIFSLSAALCPLSVKDMCPHVSQHCLYVFFLLWVYNSMGANVHSCHIITFSQSHREGLHHGWMSAYVDDSCSSPLIAAAAMQDSTAIYCVVCGKAVTQDKTSEFSFLLLL